MSAFAALAIYAALGALVCGLLMCVKALRESPRIHWWNWLGMFVLWPVFVVALCARAFVVIVEEFFT